ncbi:MAG TPA: SDR family NAD(P)-dependent oxidoreductase [Steroidobacteraceae bacterium]|jgi:NAD(P)-dependent dehydrogenase (short-subunit alcohol dehydrogenase family)|nr:SDR family NAD(P)-dependent oxidoreductase [Steroidobacteraceae bacterium]
MRDFTGRTAFVTGGANGVGIGLVRALLAQGCNVAIADIRQAHIDAALRALDNPRAMGVQVDVSSRAELARAAEAVEAKFGVVSLLFNNAGVNLFQSVEESSYDDWDWIMGVNLHGPINGVMTFVPRMIRAGTRGYVVNTASMAGLLAAGTCGIYNATKFAVRGLSESLRASLAAHGIGVSVLCPGLVKSYIYASDEIRPQALKAGAKPVNTEFVKRLAEVHQFGMEPDVIAARVLEAMREDRFHIFTHPEFRDELAEVFAEILQDFRDYPVDPGYPQRIDFEKNRRESYRKQRRGLKEM